MPAANSTLIADAVSWLEPWLETVLFQELRDAARARRPIERNFRWTLAWPLDQNPSSMIRGCTEAIYRDRQGRWRPVVVSTFVGAMQAERLRLLLSSAAAERRGYEPGGPGWWVRLDSDEKMIVDIHVNFDPSAIEQNLSEWSLTGNLEDVGSLF